MEQEYLSSKKLKEGDVLIAFYATRDEWVIYGIGKQFKRFVRAVTKIFINRKFGIVNIEKGTMESNIYNKVYMLNYSDEFYKVIKFLLSSKYIKVYHE